MAMKKTIEEMKPKDILRKESFKRIIPAPTAESERDWGGSKDYDTNASREPIRYIYPTQADFMREWDVNSHAIRSIAYYPNIVYNEGEGKIKAKIRSRVAVAYQRRIHTKRVVALTGYDPDITIAKSKTDKTSQANLRLFKEGWANKGMDTVTHLAISSDMKVGDVAVLGYKDGGKFGTRIFAFDKGDILYPHYSPTTGRLTLLGRKYTMNYTDENGVTECLTYLDVWDDTQYARYRMKTSEELRNDPEDEWILEEKMAHNFLRCPVAYHRYGEPCWANSQSLIDKYELSISQLAENNAQYALRILYTLGAEFEMEGDNNGTPRLINGQDPNSKIGFLEPADASGSFKLELETLAKEIMRSSFAVETPEISSGADVSSLTVKMLFADSYLKALDDANEYQSFLDDIVRIFIEGYGTEIQKTSDFDALGVKAKLQPWVFMSDTEVVNTLVQLVTAGVLSKRSATEYAYETLGIGAVDEIDRILTEEHDTLAGQAEVNVINNARNSQ